MPNTRRTAGALRRVGAYVLAGSGTLAAPSVDVLEGVEVRYEGEPDIDDFVSRVTSHPSSARDGHMLAVALGHMSPFDATHVAATAALSTQASVRRAIAHALTWVQLVGDDVVLDHLCQDDDEGVRAAAHNARAGEALAHRRVLVIDDYVGGRGAICECLGELECDALGTSSALLARDLPWDELVDFVVADHDPPWSDGEGLVVRIREHAPDLPAILLCRDPFERAGERTLDASIRIAKPVTLESLSTAIQALVPRRTPR